MVSGTRLGRQPEDAGPDLGLVPRPAGAVAGATGRDVLLVVDGLEVRYGDVAAVRDASFNVHRGEVIGVAGESGSGKSTLAFAIARLLRGEGRITAGHVLWYGEPDCPVDLAVATDDVLRKVRWAGVSIVLQSAMNAMNPVLTLSSQIDDVLRAHEPMLSRRERLARIGALLEMVGIPARRAGAYPHELSGGMRQRAMIALALALSPELVILDEPTTALDVVMQRQILDELDQLRERFAFAVMFITHDLSLLLEIADQVLVMYAGAVVEKASAQELYHDPRHPYSQGLLHSFPTLHGERRELLGIPGSPPNLRELPSGCPFHPRCAQQFARCVNEVPQLVPRLGLSGGTAREVACHLYSEVQDPRASKGCSAQPGGA